jgi:hypothetical protein
VLSEEQNRKLVEVSAGTPMGELLRRYWMPIGAVTELEDSSVKPVRLMGEDLVLFRDRTGHYGLPGPALRSSARRPLPRLGGGPGAPVPLPRLGVGGQRAMRAATVRRVRASRSAVQGPRAHQGISGGAESRVAVGVPRAGAGAARPDLGAVHLGQRLRADRLRRDPVQLVPVPGELNRSGALRMAARQLVARAERRWSPKPPAHLRIAFDEFEYGFTYRRILEGQSDSVLVGAHHGSADWPLDRPSSGAIISSRAIPRSTSTSDRGARAALRWAVTSSSSPASRPRSALRTGERWASSRRRTFAHRPARV